MLPDDLPEEVWTKASHKTKLGNYKLCRRSNGNFDIWCPEKRWFFGEDLDQEEISPAHIVENVSGAYVNAEFVVGERAKTWWKAEK